MRFFRHCTPIKSSKDEEFRPGAMKTPTLVRSYDILFCYDIPLYLCCAIWIRVFRNKRYELN